jgi:AcrR family transcriptional regulator
MTDVPPAPRGGRQALIEAGLALLAEGGAGALTLRRAAQRAGLSHAAPAHHFGGLPGLYAGIAAAAFRDFAATMLRFRDRAGSDPRARLLAICEGYLDFARSRAGLFQLMFAAPGVDRADAELVAAGAAAYAVLREACAPFARPGAEAEALETAVWSLVHGYAILAPALPRRDGEPAAFAGLLDRLLRGDPAPAEAGASPDGPQPWSRQGAKTAP